MRKTHGSLACAALWAATLFAFGPAAHADEGWSVVASPNAQSDQHNEFQDVTCVGPNDCWAVGQYYTANKAYQTLTEHWDGSAWTVVPSANTDPTQTNLLAGIACVSSADCWAVGKYKNIVGADGFGTLLIIDQTLIEHWDGTSWSIVISPNSQPVESYLKDVSCISATDCWAVGYARNVVTGLIETQIHHWNGNAWTLVPSPNTEGNSYVHAVDCTAAGDCWAVGMSSVDGITSQTMALQWDGTLWSLAATPNTAPDRNNALADVDCLSATDCWTIGDFDGGPGFGNHTLTAHWDGSAWTRVPSPNTDARRNNYLWGISCLSGADCHAVGTHYNGVALQSLVQLWDGSAWRIVESANTASNQYNVLWRIACAAARDCLSVGYSVGAGNLRRTLSDHSFPRVDAFASIDRTGVATNVYVTGESKTITGIDAPAPVSVVNGQYRIDGGAWTSAVGQIGAGSTLSVRHLSASTAGTATETPVTVGAYSTTFRSVTSSLDRTPEAFGFGTKTGVDPGALVESAVVTLTGFNMGISVTPGPGIAYRINGEAWTSATGTLQPNETLQVRHTSSTTSLGYTKTYLKVGSVAGYFTTRTK